MDDKILSSRDCGSCTESVCINASQIYDSCRAKECLENLHVYFCPEAQSIIDNATKVTAERAEVIWIYSDVESLPFHRGYYTINLKFFFRIEVNAYTGLRRPVTVDGLASYEKKIVLFGSEGEAKIFQSKYKEDSFDIATWKKTNMPNAIVEVVDPIVLDTVTALPDDCHACDCLDLGSVPECVHRIFDSPIVANQDCRQVFVTLGLFMMIRLEREVQITVPASTFCVPDSTCRSADGPGSPCDMFEDLCFPVDEFFPPRAFEASSCSEEAEASEE